MYASLAHPESLLAVNARHHHHNKVTTPVRNEDPPGTQHTTADAGVSASIKMDGIPTKQNHQRFVFTDPVAFRYLEEDPSTIVLARQSRLEGYELYIVEQWACSRIHPTFVITTFTGDPSRSVSVSVLSVPTDEEAWSPRLRVYFKAVSQFHARRKETPLGILMVTNLSSFPSALTVIAVPEGDVKKHREDFIVNENLKRLGCSGRAGLTLSQPITSATKAKFYQLYRTSDHIPLYSAVIELVKLCQVALTVFSKLAPEYADGLLCDVTERAINDWWTELGTEFYKVEPSDGILGPTTVAALLGMIMGARNRLNAYGAPVAKDVFDLGSLKRGIAYFQKSQKLDKTRRLDRQTLARLHRVTAKVASGDGWMVRKAVKSTVAELSGKGGEMVMGMVGAREKAGIGEVETVDIEQFIQLIRGERAKWLWFGKHGKFAPNEVLDRFAADRRLIFGNDDHGGYVWSSQKRDSTVDELAIDGVRKRDGGPNIYIRNPPDSAGSLGSHADKEQPLRRTMFKSVTGKMSDARSGLGRIKDAVGISGLRGHHHKQSKEENAGADNDYNAVESLDPQHSDVTTFIEKPGLPSSLTNASNLEGNVTSSYPTKTNAEDLNDGGDVTDTKGAVTSLGQTQLENSSVSRSSIAYSTGKGTLQETIVRKGDLETDYYPPVNEIRSDISKQDDSTYQVYDITEPLKESLQVGQLLHRTQSLSRFVSRRFERRNENWWPRHLSFSEAEEAILVWDEVGWTADDANNGHQPLVKENGLASEAKRIRERILDLEGQVIAWVEQKLADVEALDTSASRDQEELHALYYQHLDNCQALRAGFDDLMLEERGRLGEGVKDVETLGAKLEYEVNALVAKVEDVEDGVAEFERQVLDVESRVGTLEAEEEAREGWLQWAARFFMGVGMGTGGW